MPFFKNQSQSEKNAETLKKWGARDKRDLILVHTVNVYNAETTLLSNRAQSVLKTWDVISTSLISFKDLEKQNELAERSMRYQTGRNRAAVNTGLFFETGFILDVPPQNILGTFPKDVWFKNHAGVNTKNGQVVNSYSLCDHIFSGIDKKGDVQAKGGYNQIISPSALIRQSYGRHHNEVLVVGRPGVSVYPGLPPTAEIKVTCIILAKRTQVSSSWAQNAIKTDVSRRIEVMKRYNRNLPVIYI